MHLSLLSLLLALLGQPLAITQPDMTDLAQLALYQPSLMVASPMGRTSTNNYLLHGPVATMRIEISPPHEKTPRQLVQTMQFDTHGYLTEMVCAWPDENETITYSIVNQYDEQDRLKLLTLTVSQGDVPQAPGTVAVQHTYDDQGRISKMDVAISDPSDTQTPPVTLHIPITFDDNGRIAKRSVLGGANAKIGTVLESAYRYEADGRTVVESKYESDGAITQRQWFTVHGQLTEWHTYNGKGKVVAKTFVSCNAQGDPQLISLYRAGEWIRIAYDGYVYDAHGNWITRTIYALLQQDNEDVRYPQNMQYRKITYYPEEGQAE